jgi:hypothetical protein
MRDGSITTSRMDVVVDIIGLVPVSIRVRAHELQVGDRVFDAFGGQHKLTRVVRLKNGLISTRRDDHKHTEWWSPSQDLTIVRDLPEVAVRSETE